VQSINHLIQRVSSIQFSKVNQSRRLLSVSSTQKSPVKFGYLECDEHLNSSYANKKLAVFIACAAIAMTKCRKRPAGAAAD